MTSYPFITQRLWEAHKDPAVLDACLSLIRRQRGACDEIWFASDYAFPPLAIHEAAAEQMAAAAERVRAAGIVASLQISNTLGHGEYLASGNHDGIAWQRMVGPDGTVAPYSNCPRDRRFHAYLDASTRAYCAWQPASVWIDDDLRMHHHGRVAYGCFCDGCLAKFSAATGAAWTRESLVRAISAGNDLAAREAWMEFGRQSLTRVAEVIAKAAKAVAPDCRMGLQHCDPSWGGYNGPDWAPVFEVMTRISGKPVGSRPGGGFYSDHAPREMLAKALFGGLQNTRLPDCVDDVRIEVENLPGAVTGKSARGTVLEATLALAYGSTGLTFTPLMFTREEFEWHERVLSEIAAWRPFWLRYGRDGRSTRPAGLAIALSRRFTRRPLREGEPLFAWSSCHLGGVVPLMALGLPLCWQTPDAAGLLLHPHAVDGMDDDEVTALMARGVMTDGETIRRLQERGLGEPLGLCVRETDGKDAGELFTADPLNGDFASRRLGLTSLSRSFPACSLEPQGPVRILSHYFRGDGAAGLPATAAVETARGGRWIVFGNGCWDPVTTTARRAQLLAAADWVVRGGLPALLETPGQVAVVPRVDADGRLCSVLLLNCSLDATAPLRLRLRRPRSARCVWLRPNGQAIDMPLSGEDREDSRADVPGLEAWGTGVLLL